MLCVILRHAQQLIPYYACYPKIAKAFIKVTVITWLVDSMEFKIPQRRRRQKLRVKSDFSIYETLARLSQVGHYVLCRRTLPELNS